MKLLLLVMIPILFSCIILFRDFYLDKLRYRENNYFNQIDYYVFLNNLNQRFVSRVELYKGFYYTTIKERCNYKATTIKCVKL